MKTYLAVFTGSPNAMASWEKLPEAERQQKMTQGIAAWKKWATDNAAAIAVMAYVIADLPWRLGSEK